ncbi:MAG: hypothetical protein AAB441_05690, partial [Patescibacteria group bacterium]
MFFCRDAKFCVSTIKYKQYYSRMSTAYNLQNVRIRLLERQINHDISCPIFADNSLKIIPKHLVVDFVMIDDFG